MGHGERDNGTWVVLGYPLKSVGLIFFTDMDRADLAEKCLVITQQGDMRIIEMGCDAMNLMEIGISIAAVLAFLLMVQQRSYLLLVQVAVIALARSVAEVTPTAVQDCADMGMVNILHEFCRSEKVIDVHPNLTSDKMMTDEVPALSWGMEKILCLVA